MAGWICTYLPWLCDGGGGGGVSGPLGSPEMPLPPWMQEWLIGLNNATEPPTIGDLSSLANALLAAGYAEAAIKVSHTVLSPPAEFGAADDPLNQVQMQLIEARAEMALNNVDAARNLIDGLPERDALREALGKIKGLP